MLKRSDKRNFSVWFGCAMLVVLGGATGCDRNEDAYAAPAPSGRPGHIDDAPAETVYSTVVEVRHFEVYNRYRTMFDDAANYIPNHVHEHGNDIRPAIDTRDGIRPVAASAACFMQSGALND